MPWRCPACSTPIRPTLLALGQDRPQPSVIYRCNVCRLELVLDEQTNKMTVAPLQPNDVTTQQQH